jgi:hypothetical protein
MVSSDKFDQEGRFFSREVAGSTDMVGRSAVEAGERMSRGQSLPVLAEQWPCSRVVPLSAGNLKYWRTNGTCSDLLNG